MGKEAYALLTGLFVLSLGAVMVAITIWLGHYGEERERYIVATKGAVSGLNAESTVIYRGVEAGKVASIGFDPADPRTILVRIEVNRGLPITQGTYARLRIQGLTGLAQVELGDSGDDPEPLATHRDHPARIPLQPSLIDKLSDSGGNILLRAEELIVRLNELLDEENRRRVRGILANLDAATGKLAGLEERMEQAFAEMHAAAGKVNRAAGEVEGAGARLGQTLSRSAPVLVQLGELSGHLRTLAENANALVLSGKTATETAAKTTLPGLNGLLEELQSTSGQVRKLSDLLERDPQAVLYGHLPPEPGPGEPGYQEPR